MVSLRKGLTLICQDVIPRDHPTLRDSGLPKRVNLYSSFVQRGRSEFQIFINKIKVNYETPVVDGITPKVTKPRDTNSRKNPLASKKSTETHKPTATSSNELPTQNDTEAMAEASSSNSKSVNDSNGTVDNYLLLVRLISSYDPTITRLLSVPSTFSFLQFHQILQIAFGWAGCHAFSFAGTKPFENDPKADQLRRYGIRGKDVLSIHMDDDVCASMSESFNDPDIDFKACADLTLKDAYEGDKYGAVEIQYEYDHGDSWEHQITFLGKENKNVRKSMLIPDGFKVVCMAGEGHPCAEDCGGEPGWEDLKKVFKGKKADDRKDWYKNSCANGDPKGLDPYKWDILEVNRELAKMFPA